MQQHKYLFPILVRDDPICESLPLQELYSTFVGLQVMEKRAMGEKNGHAKVLPLQTSFMYSVEKGYT